MSKYYGCYLKQVSEEQGYMDKNLDYFTSFVVFRFPDSINRSEEAKEICEKLIFPEELIVVKTPDPFFVKEIATGCLIPILRFEHKCYYNDTLRAIMSEYPNDWYSHIVRPSIFNRPEHTFVSITKRTVFTDGGRSIIDDGLFEEKDLDRVKKYVKENSENEEFKKRLSDFFAQGELKKQKKLTLEKEQTMNRPNEMACKRVLKRSIQEGLKNVL